MYKPIPSHEPPLRATNNPDVRLPLYPFPFGRSTPEPQLSLWVPSAMRMAESLEPGTWCYYEGPGPRPATHRRRWHDLQLDHTLIDPLGPHVFSELVSLSPKLHVLCRLPCPVVKGVRAAADLDLEPNQFALIDHRFGVKPPKTHPDRIQVHQLPGTNASIAFPLLRKPSMRRALKESTTKPIGGDIEAAQIALNMNPGEVRVLPTRNGSIKLWNHACMKVAGHVHAVRTGDLVLRLPAEHADLRAELQALSAGHFAICYWPQCDLPDGLERHMIAQIPYAVRRPK